MSYLGGLLAGVGDTHSQLRPWVPARFEPDALIEQDLEAEAAAPPANLRAAPDLPAPRSSVPAAAADPGPPPVVARHPPVSPDVAAGAIPDRSVGLPPEVPASPSRVVRRIARGARPAVSAEAAPRRPPDAAPARPPVARPANEPVRPDEAPLDARKPVDAVAPPMAGPASAVALRSARLAAPTPAIRDLREPTQSPVVRVSIGRVDLRTPPPPPAPRAAPAPWRPSLSLDDYLRERSR